MLTCHCVGISAALARKYNYMAWINSTARMAEALPRKSFLPRKPPVAIAMVGLVLQSGSWCRGRIQIIQDNKMQE